MRLKEGSTRATIKDNKTHQDVFLRRGAERERDRWSKGVLYRYLLYTFRRYVWWGMVVCVRRCLHNAPFEGKHHPSHTIAHTREPASRGDVQLARVFGRLARLLLVAVPCASACLSSLGILKNILCLRPPRPPPSPRPSGSPR